MHVDRYKHVAALCQSEWANTSAVDHQKINTTLHAPFSSCVELIDSGLIGGARLFRTLGLGRHALKALLQPLLRKLLRLAAEVGHLLLDGRDRVAQTLLERFRDGPKRGGRGGRGRGCRAVFAAIVIVVVLFVANLACPKR
jgi:hypothetical protein